MPFEQGGSRAMEDARIERAQRHVDGIALPGGGTVGRVRCVSSADDPSLFWVRIISFRPNRQPPPAHCCPRFSAGYLTNTGIKFMMLVEDVYLDTEDGSRIRGDRPLCDDPPFPSSRNGGIVIVNREADLKKIFVSCCRAPLVGENNDDDFGMLPENDATKPLFLALSLISLSPHFLDASASVRARAGPAARPVRAARHEPLLPAPRSRPVEEVRRRRNRDGPILQRLGAGAGFVVPGGGIRRGVDGEEGWIGVDVTMIAMNGRQTKPRHP